MRIKDREVTDLSEIIEIMKNCDVCRLALNDDGFPYILPLNFGLSVNGDKITLYFHSALEVTIQSPPESHNNLVVFQRFYAEY